MTSLDRAYDRLVASFDPGLRAAAQRLPEALGLGGPGASWSSYATLRPVVDLPHFAAESLQVDDELLDRTRLVHWYGGYMGLTLDRLADGQARPGDVGPGLRRALVGRWADALADLHPRPREARILALASLQRLKAAAAEERRAFRLGSLSFGAYAALVCEKTAWFSLASCALLERLDPAWARAFVRPFRLLMLSLQLLDDGADHEEDRRERGRSVPQLLGVSPRSMHLASALLAADAAPLATAAGFGALGRWLEARAAALQAEARGGGGDFRDALDAFAALGLVATALEAA
ncbi:MAG TPA: hypothetical protein VFS43_04330 [Polyangiaceae bacterium]|nr:hypothetical protein [Polyangiaceae bacterium]